MHDTRSRPLSAAGSFATRTPADQLLQVEGPHTTLAIAVRGWFANFRAKKDRAALLTHTCARAELHRCGTLPKGELERRMCRAGETCNSHFIQRLTARLAGLSSSDSSSAFGALAAAPSLE